MDENFGCDQYYGRLQKLLYRFIPVAFHGPSWSEIFSTTKRKLKDRVFSKTVVKL